MPRMRLLVDGAQGRRRTSNAHRVGQSSGREASELRPRTHVALGNIVARVPSVLRVPVISIPGCNPINRNTVWCESAGTPGTSGTEPGTASAAGKSHYGLPWRVVGSEQCPGVMLRAVNSRSKGEA